MYKITISRLNLTQGIWCSFFSLQDASEIVYLRRSSDFRDVWGTVETSKHYFISCSLKCCQVFFLQLTIVDFISWQDSVFVGEDQFDWNEQFSSVAKQVLLWNSTETRSKWLLKKPTTFANQYMICNPCKAKYSSKWIEISQNRVSVGCLQGFYTKLKRE